VQTARSDRGLDVVSWIVDRGLNGFHRRSALHLPGSSRTDKPALPAFSLLPRACISPLPHPSRHRHPFVTPGVRSFQTARKGCERRIARTSSASCKMRSYIGVLWLLATLFSSLGLVNASGPTTSDKPGFIKAPGRKFTLDGK
jgi:hypothetical protein